MKKLILCLVIITLPILAEEIWLGMVDGADGDKLILVDGLEIYVPNLSQGRYIDEDNVAIPLTEVYFPFTASLVRDKTLPEHLRDQSIFVKIHKFHRIVQGRAVPIQD